MNYHNLIPYGQQYIDDDDIREVVRVLKSNFITQGPAIPEFEQSLADYCGALHAVVFNSGTSALHGAYFALGLGKGDEFITSPITFVATANAGLYLQAKPVFVDVEPDTGNIDASKINKKITNKTKLIAPVHYGGHPVNLENIRDIAAKHNLFVVEDACHALGARYRQRATGNRRQMKSASDGWIKIGSCKFSDLTILSFHPVKHITTGEGGAVLTNNKDFYEKLIMFRSHGITKDKNKFKAKAKVKNYMKDHLNLDLNLAPWYYEMQILGYNYRMTDIQAALGISQLKKLDSFVRQRRAIADMYNKAFIDNPWFDIPVEKEYADSSYHLYPIRLKDRYRKRKKEFFSRLRKNGIGVQVHYIPVCLQPYYRELGYKNGSCPVAEDFYHSEISLPIFPGLKQKDIKTVIEKVLTAFSSQAADPSTGSG
jgi:UDP-4-amino-4,6-dideoxy-N-acetyl-beta-L-altrosamine transaminase